MKMQTDHKSSTSVAEDGFRKSVGLMEPQKHLNWLGGFLYHLPKTSYLSWEKLEH
jgi:hypothetical protein